MEENGKVWISVDGGGTKTQFCACNIEGQKLYDRSFALSNYKSSNLKQVSENLQEAFKNLMKTLNCRESDVAGVVMGLSGCDTNEDVEVYKSIMKQTEISEEKIYICNDTEIVFRALAGDSGICVVAGTGSIACAYNKDGLIARVGGWGSPLSDQGSGYWIGAELLKQMISWLDGEKDTDHRIYDEIAARLKRPDQELQWTLASLSITEVASLAVLVLKYALQDEKCMSIIEEAAASLAKQICIVYEKASFKESTIVVLVGGLFRNEIFAAKVKQYVKENLKDDGICFKCPEKSPAEEGLTFALRAYPK